MVLPRSVFEQVLKYLPFCVSHEAARHTLHMEKKLPTSFCIAQKDSL